MKIMQFFCVKQFIGQTLSFGNELVLVDSGKAYNILPVNKIGNVMTKNNIHSQYITAVKKTASYMKTWELVIWDENL